MSSVKCVVIAAAGIGKRLGRGVPKCLIELNGYPVYEYQLKLFRNADEIRMVVGFEDERVIKEVTRSRRDVIFVRNPAFETTSTLQSMFLGCRGVKGKCLFIDGDMIVSEQSFCNIEKQCEQDTEFIGVTTDISEDPVYAAVRDGWVDGFCRQGRSQYEWANIAYVDSSRLQYLNTHFYVQLQKYLPLKAVEVERLEIDTPHDLEHAEKILAVRRDFVSLAESNRW